MTQRNRASWLVAAGQLLPPFSTVHGSVSFAIPGVAFRFAPASEANALEMIRSAKGFPLPSGFRVGPSFDLEALSQTIVHLSELAVAGKGLIQSIDLNPFTCLSRGGKAVDAVIITRNQEQRG